MTDQKFVIKCGDHPSNPSKGWNVTINSRIGLLLAMQAGLVLWWDLTWNFSISARHSVDELKAFFDTVAIEYEESIDV